MGSNTVFVLLAGGKSERMGVAKGLLKYQHTFWILEQLNRVSKTTISEVYIGLGFNYQDYFNAIPWLEDALTNPVDFQGLAINVVINKQPESGAFSTLQSVLKKINTTYTILLNHIDIPILNSEELHKIIETTNTIVIPNYKGKNGHPVKMDFSFWQHLQTLNVTDATARLDFQIKKVSPSKISTIEVNDCTIIKNLNTTKEWLSYLNEIDNL